MPKLSCNDCKTAKTASLNCDDSLTAGAKGMEGPTGLVIQPADYLKQQ